VTWLGLIQALLIAIGALADWLGKRRLIAAGAAEAIAAHLRTALDEIALANRTRDSVRASLERDPGGLRDDGGFERK
jgi:hypothetical protein